MESLYAAGLSAQQRCSRNRGERALSFQDTVLPGNCSAHARWCRAYAYVLVHSTIALTRPCFRTRCAVPRPVLWREGGMPPLLPEQLESNTPAVLHSLLLARRNCIPAETGLLPPAPPLPTPTDGLFLSSVPPCASSPVSLSFYHVPRHTCRSIDSVSPARAV